MNNVYTFVKDWENRRNVKLRLRRLCLKSKPLNDFHRAFKWKRTSLRQFPSNLHSVHETLRDFRWKPRTCENVWKYVFDNRTGVWFFAKPVGRIWKHFWAKFADLECWKNKKSTKIVLSSAKSIINMTTKTKLYWRMTVPSRGLLLLTFEIEKKELSKH